MCYVLTAHQPTNFNGCCGQHFNPQYGLGPQHVLLSPYSFSCPSYDSFSILLIPPRPLCLFFPPKNRLRGLRWSSVTRLIPAAQYSLAKEQTAPITVASTPFSLVAQKRKRLGEWACKELNGCVLG